jgi:hypothetical protein
MAVVIALFAAFKVARLAKKISGIFWHFFNNGHPLF